MKKCDNCGKLFPVEIKIDGKVHNLNSRRYCLECSPFGAHNTRPMRAQADKGAKICTACKQEKSLEEFYKKGASPHSECKTCFNARSKERQQSIKRRAVEYKGGKCQRCGYQGHIASYDFHHKNPKEKSFTISVFKNWSFWRIKSELDKCILLCANCHRELEALGDEADWSFLD
jgi:hypothetical protein